MIISRTPLRISFVGGGTDIKKFYAAKEFGAVVSTAINKYMYVMITDNFDNRRIKLSYTAVEDVASVDEIKHDLIREAMRITNSPKGLQIITTSDVPSKGSGLGSSSTLTVGLLNALYAYQGKRKTPEELAREASHIEIDIIGSPIGKQDQYAAAYGGLNYIQFNADESVFVRPAIISNSQRQKLINNLMLFHTGVGRSTNEVLSDQQKEMDDKSKMEIMRKMRDLCIPLQDCIVSDLNKFGKLLDENWKLKAQMSKKISNDQINEWYEKAIKAGALGGKLLGAGGGGFLLFYCEEKYQHAVRTALSDLRQIPFSFEKEGSKIIYFD
jgi:D-glycero-alpha-D-manno-heptose-7-phosphate kinase